MLRAALALAFLAACAGSKPSPPSKEPQSAPSTSDFSDRYWPRARPFLSAPVVSVSPSGERTVKSLDLPPAVSSAYDAAERAFHAKNCPEAERRYKEVLEGCPGCYPALIGLGDCELIERKPVEAIEHYREAERLNPDDFLAFFSEADASARMGNFGEARELLTRALVLRPGRETVLEVLHLIEGRIGAVIDDQPLRPKAAFVNGNNLVVATGNGDPASVWWSIYAFCKKIGSPEQIARLGHQLPEGRPWNSVDEEACLRMTAKEYGEKRRAKGDEPALERFLEADAAGLAQGFVLYEVAARIDPQIVLEIPPDRRKLVDRYVRTIVIRDRGR
jgi:tetratricopeptide (TPR) repeat protein